jgi:DNA-3-methyladenine glycosylase II
MIRPRPPDVFGLRSQPAHHSGQPQTPAQRGRNQIPTNALTGVSFRSGIRPRIRRVDDWALSYGSAVARTVSAELDTRGPFSLAAAAGFGFGPNEGRPPPFDGAMRLAFPVDGGTGHAGVVARQPSPNGPVELELQVTDGAEPESAVRQVARILSLDHDGNAFLRVGDADPVLGALQRAHPGQRPVLFHSPYEAAAWSVISARRPAAQAATTRRRLADELGVGFVLAGQSLSAFPQPEALLDVGPGPGLPEEKVARLHGVARAALDGELDVTRLHELGPERALEAVQRLHGIGPFYAGLIVLRASGFADAMLDVPERKGLAHAQRFYGFDHSPTVPEFAALAERWRPFRTWAIVLIRVAGERGTG